MSNPAATAPRSRGIVVSIGLIAAVVVAVVLNALVALVAHATGASPAFTPLQFPTYTAFTVIGVLAGAAGWALIRARAHRPRALLPALVPAVVVISFVPDVLVGVTGSMPGTSWGAVVALMVMHVVVTAVAVGTYARVLPLPDRR